MLKRINFDLIFAQIQALQIKKLWKINENGHKVKVRRDRENAYSIYLDGHYITTLADSQDSFKMVKTLLES
jgi:hypothetical protein